MSAMKHYSYRTILYLLIFKILILTLAAQSEDSDCYSEIRVHHNTVYNALLGQELKINCTIIFCKETPPTVPWYKVGNTVDIVNVSGDSHIKTQWIPLKDSAGISYLIFQNIRRSDSGQYQCQSRGSQSPCFHITVYDDVKLTTSSWTTLAPVNTPPAGISCQIMYRVVGSMVFVSVIILICFTSKRGCKGKPRKTTKPSQEFNIHIYDNDP